MQPASETREPFILRHSRAVSWTLWAALSLTTVAMTAWWAPMDSFNDGVMILLWMAGVLLVPLALVHIYHAHSLAGTATRWSAIVFTAITVVLLATFGFQAVEWGAAKNGAFNDGADQAAGALFVAMFPAMAAGVLEGHLGHARAAARKAKQSWRGDGEADR